MEEDNLAVVFHGKLDLRLEQRPLPDEPGEKEVLLKTHSVGICGSDVCLWTKGHLGDFILKKPVVTGHESSATVLRVGPGVTHLQPGDKVAVEPNIPCRRCEFCSKGNYHLCRSLVLKSMPPHNGNLSRYFLHSADLCYKLPDHVSFEEGAFLEPLSVAVHACQRGGLILGQSVLIYGAGAIGLACLLVAKALGIRKICIVDIVQSRLDKARSLGCPSAVLATGSSEETLKKIIEELNGQPDVTLECTASDLCIRQSISATKPGGVVVIVGLGADLTPIPLTDVIGKELDIKGTFTYPNCYPIALALVASGKIDVKPLVTHKFPLEEAPKAFEMARARPEGVVKIMIQCQKE